MKNKKITELAAMGMMMMTSASSAFAQSDNVRGGGTVIDRHGYKELRDLLANSACEWKLGSEMIDQNPEVLAILEKVAKIDWYFANVVEREIRKIDWCLTGTLKTLNVEDRDALTTPVMSKSIQVAIRMLESNEVYVDQATFDSLSPQTRAFTLLHEAIHSFLNAKDASRNEHLRSTVKALKLITTNAITTRTSFYKTLQKNNTNYPAGTDFLDPIKNYITYILGNNEVRLKVLQQNTIESLVPTSKQIENALPWLTKEDYSTIVNTGIYDIVQDVCTSDNAKTIEQIISALSFEHAGICLSFVNRNNADLRAKLVQTTAYQKWINILITNLGKKTIVKQAGHLKIQSIAATMTLSRPSDESVPLTSLNLANTYQWKEMNPYAISFYNYLRTLLEKNETARIDALINDSFYTAFSFQAIQNQIDATTTDVPREKDLAVSIAQEVPQRFWEAFFSTLKSDLGEAKALELKSKLNQTKLGIKL